MEASLYKVLVTLEPREDGGLRVWSEDVPELVLSHANAEAVIADLPNALAVILSERLGGDVQVSELKLLPTEPMPLRPAAGHREFAARVAA